jgi:formylglycine-generating enzyme required for sulfatase activity
MGSPEGEPGRRSNEDRFRAHIPYSFDIAATEVTVAQFRRFIDGEMNPERDKDALNRYSKYANGPPEAPQTEVTWHDAARFCNWLSKEEGIAENQWCYRPDKEGRYSDMMRIARNYRELTGYRLPTEAEWEYACRAGTQTCRSFGDSEELLTRYACCILNSEERPLPVATLLPNALGLFDLHGNVSEWCQEKYEVHLKDYDGGAAEAEDDSENGVEKGKDRPVRGGSFANHPRRIRTAIRYKDAPIFQDILSGFRPARSRPAR